MMNTLNQFDFNTNRSFGVEIEFFGVHYSTVIDALTRKGINVKHESYNHTTRRHWKLVFDASVTNTGTGNYRGGHEIVSPVLRGKEGLNELKIVLDTLDEIGASVDRTCGLHVHHDVNDFELENFKNIYYLYYKFEKFFDAVVAPSRRGNNNTYCQGIRKAQVEALKNACSLNDINSIFSSRYCKLNFQSFFRQGTIEFRQHGGTINSEKVLNWIIFTQAIVERGKLETIRVSHDREEVTNDKHERRLRRTLFGNSKVGVLDNEYGKAFKFQVSRRKYFESRVA
ncbi:amidoligase family protein [Fredinandcohnia humi]